MPPRRRPSPGGRGGRWARRAPGWRRETVRAFLDADLVDELHVVVVPIVLGRGQRLWDGQEGLEERFDIEVLPAARA